LARSVDPRTLEKWRRVHEGNAGATRAQSQSLGSTLPRRQRREFEKELAATSWQYGENQKPYELSQAAELRDAEVIGRASSKSEMRPAPGDHTKGIHGSTPHFASEYWRFGPLPNQSAKKYELPLGAELQESGLIRRSQSSSTMARTGSPGDHTNGLARTSHLRSEYQKLGQVSGWRASDFGAPAKHNFSGVATFPETKCWRRANACHDGVAATEGGGGGGRGGPEENDYRAGDHTLGIQSSASHFSTTYDQHGRIPGWKGRRHNFGPVLSTQLRLTEWQ